MSTTEQIPRPDRTHELGAVRADARPDGRPDVRTPYRPVYRPDAPPARTLTVGRVSGVLLLAAVLGGLTGGVYALVTASPPPPGSVVDGGRTPGPPPASSAPPSTTEVVVTPKPSGNVRTIPASPRAASTASPSPAASGSAPTPSPSPSGASTPTPSASSPGGADGGAVDPAAECSRTHPGYGINPDGECVTQEAHVGNATTECVERPTIILSGPDGWCGTKDDVRTGTPKGGGIAPVKGQNAPPASAPPTSTR
jgi:hypothetical protein